VAKGWQKIHKERFREAMKGSGGNKTIIAHRLACNRATVDNYLKKHEDLLQAFEDESEKVCDLVESRFIKTCLEGSERAMMFYLDRKGRKRGWGREPGQQAATPNAAPGSGLSEEELSKIARGGE